MQGQCKPGRGEKHVVMGKTGTQRGVERKGWGRQVCRGDEEWHREKFWPARPPEREVRPQKVAHPIL